MSEACSLEAAFLDPPSLPPSEQQSLFDQLYSLAHLVTTELPLDSPQNSDAAHPPSLRPRFRIFPGHPSHSSSENSEAVRGLWLPDDHGGVVEPGAVLLSIPFSLALSVPLSSPKSGRSLWGSAAVAELACQLINATSIDPDPPSMQSHLSDEDNAKQAFWKLWAQMLPRQVTSITDWPDADVDLLQFPSDIEEVRRAREGHQSLEEAVVAATGVPAGLACWAIRIVLSRAFALPVPCQGVPRVQSRLDDGPEWQQEDRFQQTVQGRDEQQQQQKQQQLQQQQWVQAVVPLIDMANHAPEALPVKGQDLTLLQDKELLDLSIAGSFNATWRLAQGPPRQCSGNISSSSTTTSRRSSRSSSNSNNSGRGRGSGSGEHVLGEQMQMQLLARGRISPGQQVLISYGPHPSLYFLLNFGFLPLRNPGAKVLLYSSLQEMMDDAPTRIRFLRQKEDAIRSLAREDTMLWATAGGYATELFDFLGLLHASSIEELQRLEDAMHRSSSLRFTRVMPETRAAAAHQIASRCDDILRSLPTSVEDDLKDYSQRSEASDGNAVVALRYRIQQKLMLRECSRKCQLIAKQSCSK